MGLVRGYIGFENRTLDDMKVFKDWQFLDGIDLYTTPRMMRDGKIFENPTIFLHGTTLSEAKTIVQMMRRRLELKTEREGQPYLPHCDLSTANDPDYIHQIKEGNLEGDYTGIRVVLAEEDGMERMIRKATELALARSNDVLDILVRGVETRADGKQKYCIDVITDKKKRDYADIVGKSDRLRLQGRLNVLPWEYMSMLDLKRLR